MASTMTVNASAATMAANTSVATTVAHNSTASMAVNTSAVPITANHSLPLAMNISLTVIGIIIAVANGTIFLVFFSNRSLRTLTNYFVLSLAVCDFFVGTILLPIQVWSPNPDVLGPLIAFMLVASLTNICGCTYDRYVAVQDPLRYHAILTPSKVRKVILWIWTVPLVVALIPQTWLHLKTKTKNIQNIYVGFLSFGILLACMVLAWIYVGIFRVAKRHVDAISCLEDFAHGQRRGTKSGMKRRNSIKSLVKHVKAAKLAAAIGLAFVFCWLPLVIINIFDSFGSSRYIPDDFVTVALFTLFANSLINPLIYAFFQKDFRLTLFKLIRKKFSKRENSEFQSSAKKEESSALFGPNLDKSTATFNDDQLKNEDSRKRQEASKRPSTVSFHLPGPETSRL